MCISTALDSVVETFVRQVWDKDSDTQGIVVLGSAVKMHLCAMYGFRQGERA